MARTLLNIAAVALLLASPLFADRASAGATTIQYTITGGAIGFPGSLTTPYTGSGTYTVRYQAGSAYSLQSGPSTLLTVNVTAGPVRTGLIGVPGTYPATHLTFGSLAFVSGVGRVDTGFVNVSGSQNVGPPSYVSVPTGSANSGGAAWWEPAAGVGRLSLQSLVSTLFLVPNAALYTGTEVSRSFVPEPTTGSLFAVALAGLGASALARRRAQKSTARSSGEVPQ